MKRIFSIMIFAVLAIVSVNADEPFNGIVYDAQGNPLKNVKIYVKDSRRYATSDKLGRFGLTNVQPDDTIHLMVKKRKYPYIIPVEGRKSMKIFLADENTRVEQDDELVNFGYGFVKRREYTGTSNGISGEELLRTGRPDIMSALVGKVPGLDITPSGVTIRGEKSLIGSSEPLYIVDGNIVPNFNGINLHHVAHVEVLKDASIYGSRGANGAILVFTKNGNSKNSK